MNQFKFVVISRSEDYVKEFRFAAGRNQFSVRRFDVGHGSSGKATRLAMTYPSGYYGFDGRQSGDTNVFSVISKQFQFPP